MSIRTSNPIQTSNLQPSSVPPSSLSISLPSPVRPLPLHLFRKIHRARLSEVVTATCLMYVSLLISLLAAFVAMLGEQWLNRYLRNSGGSMIERCGDRQRKCSGLEKWSLYFFVESLPVMLQVSLLLVCGLCRHMWPINAPVARISIGLTGLGAIFYIAIVIAGTSSYACPFQTPVSTTLCDSWKKVRPGIISLNIYPKRMLSRTRRVWNRGVRSLLRRQSLPTIPLGSIEVRRSGLWLRPRDLAIIRRTNANDIQCLSWIFRNNTDSEALDAVIRLAGVVRWFDDGINDNPPSGVIVSTFEARFDSTRTLYPGSRDRAYCSGRAIIWIRTLAMCKSEEFAREFPLPVQKHTTPVPDPDLDHLPPAICGDWAPSNYIDWLLITEPAHTHPLTVDFKSTPASFPGQPDQTEPSGSPGLLFCKTQDRNYHPSEHKTQPPPRAVHLPRISC